MFGGAPFGWFPFAWYASLFPTPATLGNVGRDYVSFQQVIIDEVDLP
jgi:hypothetical protein